MIIHSSSAGSSIVNDSANIYNNQDNMQQPEDQKEKDIEDETKRVTIYRNGTNTNGHVIYCSKFSLSYFLKRASFLFGETINFKRVFNTSGGEIHDVKLILPNEILFLSEGEDFIHLYNYHTTNCTSVVSNPHVSQYMHTDQSSTTTPHKESNFFIPPFPAPFITKELASSNNRKEKEFESFKFRLLPLLEKYDIAKEKEHFLSALFSCVGGSTCISGGVDSAVDTNSSACVGNVSSSPSSNPIPLLTASTNEGITTAITSPSCNTRSSCRGKNKKKKNKALTGYNIFYRRLCSQFKQKGVEVKGQVSKTISKAWNQLNDEEKSKYDDEARQENIKSQQQLLLVQQQETENVSNSPNTKDAVVSSTTSLITSGIKSLSGLSTSTSEESLSPRSLNNNNNKRKAFEGTFPSSTPVMMVNQPFPSTRYLVPPTSSFNLAPQQISATSMMGRSPLPSQAELHDNDKTNHLLPSFSSFSSPSTTGGQPTLPPPLQQLPSSHELYYNRSSPIPPPSFLHSPPLFPTMPIKTIENKESNNTHLYTYENPNIESLERKKQKK